MKTVEIIGYKRANLGKSESKRLRADQNVPCVLYGGEKQVHFYSPAILFRDVLYTDEAHFIHLNIEGEEYQAILQDVQFHPVSEMILHVDFLQIFEGKSVKMEIPLHFVGNSKGVINGGVLVKKRRKLRVSALPKNMPDHIDVDITNLDFHKAVKVGDITTENFEVLDSTIASVAVVEVPRAMKGKTMTAEEEAAEEEAAAEATEAAASAEE
ncbi:MAG: 50S ribosomal protein L25/general stress protein Ctc [Cyclobacteriaceae bacterium]|nr:50S ribosomal protein L25/general stress protein Ctc [Cyclobacteriaceae bacterium]